MSSLPGPHKVSFVRDRVVFDDSSSSGSVFVSVCYPTTGVGKGKDASYWPASAIEGLAQYVERPLWMFQHLRARHPCGLEGLQVLLPDAGGWPVVVFSHGLGGNANMYSEMCRALASYGYIVLAVEHADGSGCYAESLSGEPIFYKVRPGNEPYGRQVVTKFRAPFLDQRVKEISGVLSLLQSAARVEKPALIQTAFAAADAKRLSFVGHSFGAATVTLAAQRLKTQLGDLGCVVLLDTWAYCLPEETLIEGLKVPTLSLLSAEWLTKDELPEVVQLLSCTLRDSGGPASFYYPRAVHQSFSDSQLWFPSAITESVNSKGRGEDAAATHRAVAEATHLAITTAAEIDAQKSQQSAFFADVLKERVLSSAYGKQRGIDLFPTTTNEM